jgi:hypothetical protein
MRLRVARVRRVGAVNLQISGGRLFYGRKGYLRVRLT